MHRFRQVFAAIGVATLCTTGTWAADWPTKPITVVNSYPVGGAGDVVTRIVLNELGKNLGQPVVADNKIGANSNIAADWVARAKPDGYTLLVTSPWFAINQYVETGRRWKPNSLTPVVRFALTDNVLAVSADSQFRTVSELVSFARQQSAPLQFGSPGEGSTQRMAAELFLRQAGIRMDAVQYKGAPPIIPDLVSGRVSMAVLASANVAALMKAGKLRGLATFGETRAPGMPDISTMAEQGYPKAVVTSWFGLHAPAGTPPEVIKRVADAVKQIVADPQVQAALRNVEAQAAYLDTEQFADYIQSELALWKDVSAHIEDKK